MNTPANQTLLNEITPYACYHKEDVLDSEAYPEFIFISRDPRDIGSKIEGAAKEDFINKVVEANLQEGQTPRDIIYPGVFVDPFTHKIIKSPDHRVVHDILPMSDVVEEAADEEETADWFEVEDEDRLLNLYNMPLYEFSDCTTVFLNANSDGVWNVGTTANSWDGFRLSDYGISYGKAFKETLDKCGYTIDYSTLDTDKMYTILFSNPSIHKFTSEHKVVCVSEGLTLDEPVRATSVNEYGSYMTVGNGVMTVYMCPEMSEMRYDFYNDRNQYALKKGSDSFRFHILGLMARENKKTTPSRAIKHLNMWDYTSDDTRATKDFIEDKLKSMYTKINGRRAVGRINVPPVVHKKKNSYVEFRDALLIDRLSVLKFIVRSLNNTNIA
jgi:hypothetical protein